VEGVPNQVTVQRCARLGVSAVLSALLAIVIGCSSTTSGVGVKTPVSSTSPVNASMLDPGRFPTTPQPQAGAAGSDQAGRLAEGHRMANYTIGPWQVDPALSAHLAGDVAVLDAYEQLSHVVWPWVVGAALQQPFLVGFTSERRNATGSQRKQLRNAVLRFADDRSASTVAQGIYDKSMHFPRVEDITPVVTEPEQSIPIPGHPDAHGALITYQQGADRLQELDVATAHGPFVLVQVIQCAAAPDCPAQLAARTLDLQLPLIDTFVPTPAGQFGTVPLDPSGLVARTLPMPPGEATSTTGAAYKPAGALHFENDPATIGPALADAKVDEVSINRATIYQTATPDAAQKLLQVYGDTFTSTPGSQTVDGVPGLPQSRCTLIPGPGGIVPHHWCVATVDRYMIKTVARQADTARHEVAAQYRILHG
jgi:hypothetical protein